MAIAVYNDDSRWKIVNPAANPCPNEWHPLNAPARRLCRCIEGVRDLRESVAHVLAAKNRAKRRRRLRSAIVPLHSLCVSTVDLVNSIQSERNVAERLPQYCGSDITQLREFLRQHVPFEREGKLKILRDKLSAHYDRDMHPIDMRTVNLSVDLTEVAEWIGLVIAVLCDILKLNVFMWSGDGYAEAGVMIMCTDPIMTDFRVEEGRIVGINGCYLSQSPRWEVYSDLKALWKLSDRLFERSSPWRIKCFLQDGPGQHWSKVLRDYIKQ